MLKILLLSIFLVFSAIPALSQLTDQDIAELQQQAVEEGWSFEVGENSATQYSLDQLCGLKVPPDWQENAVFDPMTIKRDLPSRFDWRDSTTLPVVKNQGGCGSCWAFATVGPLECNIKIKDNVTVDLSEQWLVSCNSNGWDCGGGWWAHDYHEWRSDPCGGTGTVSEADFPYTATNGTCSCPYDHEYLIDNWAYVGSSGSVPSVDAMKQAIIDHGPISVALHANSALQGYNGGIFDGCYNGEINHGVTLVGWDDSQGAGGVWFMRNSWGTGWGEDGGYARMEYGCSYLGYGACYVNYPGSKNIAFNYPSGIPTTLTPDQASTFEVIVSGIGSAIPIPNSGQLYYSIDGGAVQSKSMTQLATNQYEASLPPISCGSRVSFFVSVEEMVDGTYYDPDPGSPNSALAVEDSVVIFEDNFETDKGWLVTGNATAGNWERGTPVGGGDRGDPATDFDGSGQCYLTENVDDDSDVDGGTTILISPTFDLSDGDGKIHFALWYSNDYGSTPNTDTFKVFISNDAGSNWVLAEKIGPVEKASGGWYEHTFLVSDFVTPTALMQVNFNASDLGDGSVVEAAIDDFSVLKLICGTPGPQIATYDLPEWTVNMPYSQQLEATGGTGTLVWSDKYGELAGTGLTLSSTGLLAGTPMISGQISFTAMVTDDESATGERFLTVDINPHIQITTTSLPEWTSGQIYYQDLAATGGTGAYLWADKNSDLTGTGLSVADEGNISGVPMITGEISFTASVSEGCGDSDESPLAVNINSVVSITTETLPDATENEAYSNQLAMTGGTGEIIWTDKNNDLDGTGLTMSADGLIFGAPLAIGTIQFAAKAEDITGSTDEQGLTIEVVAAWICGDVDGSEAVNLLDVTYLINFLYKNGSAPIVEQAADVDNSGDVNILDVTHLINFLYKGGTEPTCL